MITLDLRKLQQRLESKDPAELYLVVGDENFLVLEALAILKAKAVAAGMVDFDCDFFDVGETGADRVKETVEMLPMMSPRRLVVYRGIENLKGKDWDMLMPVIEHPVESTTFVLVGESLDKRKRAYKRLSEAAVMVELKRSYDNQLSDWIDYLAFRHGLKLGAEAVQLLRQFVGANLTELNNELMKLKDYLGERTQIDAKDVMQVVSQSRVDRIFDLTDAIGRQDRVSALQSLANLLEHGQNEVGALAMITRHFRIISALMEGRREGLTGAKLTTKAGIPQFLLNSYLAQLRHWDEQKINRTFSVLRDTDRALKSSSLPSHVWLENFVLKTCEG